MEAPEHEVPASDSDLSGREDEAYKEASGFRARYVRMWLSSVIAFDLRKQYEKNLEALLKTGPHEEIFEFQWLGRTKTKNGKIRHVELSGIDEKSFNRVHVWLEEDGLRAFTHATKDAGLVSLSVDVLAFILDCI